ncbi:cadherin-related family member 4 isoform X4 [Misgurnus anguillicaudatus]|uniref:cadherin-related family member 4 isoform X4 n=2 Tax=Misgurnus anguillicaudatus TaxID=75329 RepID=UPI003CCF7DE8
MSVTPSAAVFEDPVINPTNISNIFTVQIFLNGSLDYETDRLYTIQLDIITTSRPVEQSFNLRVINVNEPPDCEAHFKIPGAEVRVSEDTSAFVPLYRVLTKDPDENDTITFSISHVMPATSQFHIDYSGRITSNQTFDYHKGPKDFSVSVVVRDRAGANCSGLVHIKVLEVFKDSIDFLFPIQKVSIQENQGAEDFVASVKANPNISVSYTFVTTYPPYKIGRDDGVIRTSYNLDLESDSTLTQNVLLVRAFSESEGQSGTATVTVNVLDVNEHPPFCSPDVIVLTVAETTEVGKSLATVACVDIDISNFNVSLTLIENSLSIFKFRLRNGQLQVNSSLDYDTEEAASNHFQYEAVILAIDSGIPALTTEVQILVTVTPINEFEPQILGPLILPVPEDVRRGAFIGVVNAIDRDWPFNSLRLSFPGGDSAFTIDPVGGQLYLSTELDFEEKQFHRVKIQAVDFDQDVDKTNQRTGATDIIIQVQNVNDNAPVCNPLSYKSIIFSTLGAGVPIVTLSCTDPDRDPLMATITNGAVVDRFQMNGLGLTSKNLFSYVPDGVYDDTMFEVTVQVSDGKYSTDVVAYITVVPWSTTKPTTTTKGAPQVITVLKEFWDPEPWFVAVLTVTGVLLLLSLGLIIWTVLIRGLMEELKTQVRLQC